MNPQRSRSRPGATSAASRALDQQRAGTAHRSTSAPPAAYASGQRARSSSIATARFPSAALRPGPPVAALCSGVPDRSISKRWRARAAARRGCAARDRPVDVRTRAVRARNWSTPRPSRVAAANCEWFTPLVRPCASTANYRGIGGGGRVLVPVIALCPSTTPRRRARRTPTAAAARGSPARDHRQRAVAGAAEPAKRTPASPCVPRPRRAEQLLDQQVLEPLGARGEKTVVAVIQVSPAGRQAGGAELHRARRDDGCRRPVQRRAPRARELDHADGGDELVVPAVHRSRSARWRRRTHARSPDRRAAPSGQRARRALERGQPRHERATCSRRRGPAAGRPEPARARARLIVRCDAPRASVPGPIVRAARGARRVSRATRRAP